MVPAHPRSRGENINWVRTTHYTLGSSPLTRGKPAVANFEANAAGLIPAHAGKTPPRAAGTTWSGAHPRSRGENAASVGIACTRPGSSPLTRGKRNIKANAVKRSGLIPAHAGKT